MSKAPSPCRFAPFATPPLSRLMIAALWIVCVAWTVRVDAQALVVGDDFRSAPLGARAQVWVDTEGTHDIEDVLALSADRFASTGQEVPSYGFTSAAYWFRLVVENPQAHGQQWLLEIAYPHLDHLDLYGPSEDGALKHSAAGDGLPFHARDVDYRNVVFEVETPPGQHVYLLRVASSGPLTVPITAWSMRGFLDHIKNEYPILWMFYGLMIVMAVYNLFVFFAVRQLPYLYYVLYITAFVLFQFTLNGLSYQYLWPNASEWTNRFSPTSIGLAFALGVQFMRHFVDMKRHVPRFDRVVFVLGPCGGMATVALAQVAPVWLSVRVAIFVGITVIVISLPGVGWLAFKGNRQARYYLAAWTVFFAGILLYLFKSIGIIPTNAITEWTIQAGAALEVVLLSLGLADKINVMRRDLAGLNQQLESNVARLTTALDEAEQAQRAKSAFLASVSHELRTPLNAIINIPEGLIEQYREVDVAHCNSCRSTFDVEPGEVVSAQTPCPECARTTLAIERQWVFKGSADSAVKNLKLVHRAGSHLLDVVSDILDISKLEAGRMGIHPKPMDLAELVRDVSAPMYAVASAKGVQLALDLPTDARMVSGDATKLRQVVLNLISNAIKFSDGRGMVQVTLRDESAHVCVAVRDEGMGIAEQDKPRIFGRFMQAQSQDTRRFGGTGLGLAISKQLVDLHGGELWFESEQGRGSAFFVRLRRLDAAATVGAATA